MPKHSQTARQILFVQKSGFLPGTITGANVSLDALCRRLLGKGMAPIVVCGAAAQGDAPGGAFPSYGYPVLRLGDPFAGMDQIIARLSPAAVVVRGFPAAAAAAKTALRFRRPIHVYITAPYFEAAYPPREADSLLRYAGNSPFTVQMAELYLGRSVAHVPSIVEPSAYRCAGRRDAVLFINPVPAKGAYIAAGVARGLPRRRFVFVRSWAEQSNHPHIALDLPNVEWAESTADMRKLYARARLLLVPSVWDESWARSVSEAQISGIPVVASDRGGLPESVGPGGMILPLAAPVARWSAAVEALFTDARKHARLSRLAKQHARRPEQSPARIVGRFLKFIAA